MRAEAGVEAGMSANSGFLPEPEAGGESRKPERDPERRLRERETGAVAPAPVLPIKRSLPVGFALTFRTRHAACGVTGQPRRRGPLLPKRLTNDKGQRLGGGITAHNVSAFGASRPCLLCVANRCSLRNMTITRQPSSVRGQRVQRQAGATPTASRPRPCGSLWSRAIGGR